MIVPKSLEKCPKLHERLRPGSIEPSRAVAPFSNETSGFEYVEMLRYGRTRHGEMGGDGASRKFLMLN